MAHRGSVPATVRVCVCARTGMQGVKKPVSLQRCTIFLSPRWRVMLAKVPISIVTAIAACGYFKYQVKNTFVILNFKHTHTRTPLMLISSIPKQTPSAKEDYEVIESSHC